MSDPRPSRLGAVWLGGGRCLFTVWAPKAKSLAVRVRGRSEPLASTGDRGYFSAEINGLEPGDHYRYILDGASELPDPASRWQPEGVHGPSAIVAPDEFRWSENTFVAPALRDLVIYELHVGTFTDQGTFDAAIPQLRNLREFGVTAVEPLPLAAFPGERNWGYDGVYPFSIQESYGGPVGFARFVDAAHREGLAVIVDVVYNHLGPDGNYLAQYGHYFTERYQTPWGAALNMDGAGSDEVRRYFIESALMYLREYRVDGFRLDAVHAIIDRSANPFLAEIATTIRREAASLGRTGYVIAESDLNDSNAIRPAGEGRLGHDAQWADDLHHAMHALLTGERAGYYQDFGTTQHLATALERGYTYAGEYSRFRKRSHGNSPEGCLSAQFVVASQNHDQVGNRMRGDRLSTLVSFAQLKLAAATYLLSAFTPLIFMGEEDGETAPFQYFTSHSDPELAGAVSAGRAAEFESFGWAGEVSDPQDVSTYEESKLQRIKDGRSAQIRGLYRELLRLRREVPALTHQDLGSIETTVVGSCVLNLRVTPEGAVCVVLNYGEDGAVVLPIPEGAWRIALDTSDQAWGGSRSRTTDDLLVAGNAITLRVASWSAVLLVRDGLS